MATPQPQPSNGASSQEHANQHSTNDENSCVGDPSHANHLNSNQNGPLPTLAEVLACQISAWYPMFATPDHRVPEQSPTRTTNTSGGRGRRRSRTKITIPTVIVPLSDDFVSFLKQEANTCHHGIRLPWGAKTSSILRTQDKDDDDRWSTSTGSSDENDTKDVSNGRRVLTNDTTTVLPSFPELDEQIQHAIQTLGTDAVVPKLNWSSPKDAVWINNGSLACQTSGDIYLLLQASDFCSYDLHHALTDVVDKDVPMSRAGTTPSETTLSNDSTSSSPTPSSPSSSFQGYCLALRKWCTLYPTQEFRCFVKHHHLMAISQRHHSICAPHLKREELLVKSLIGEFFSTYIQHVFANNTISNYVLDVYIDKQERVWLLDFNVWGPRTDPLLFDWDELLAWPVNNNDNHNDDYGGRNVELRVVETSKQVRIDPLSSYRAPIDTVHVASLTSDSYGRSHTNDTNDGSTSFDAFRKLCVPPSQLDDDESSSDDAESNHCPVEA